MKKLTKVQKEILQTLRDNPRASVRCEYNNVYRLYIGDKRERTLIWDTWLFLRIWLKERDRHGRTLYTFREGAEISDAWRTEEIERQRRKQEIKGEAYQALVRRLRNVFAAIERGDIDNVDYSSRLRFEYAGKWYNLVEE